MMKQYAEIKERHSDCLLFFRLGDFYELFNEDAKIGSTVLNITLTKRPRGRDGDIPMAGVPFHAADIYISKLVKAGYKVAICEQISEPSAKGIVEREVIRIVTPGTIMDEKTLSKKEHNYVMSISCDKKSIGIAVADISTGDFQTTEIRYVSDVETHCNACLSGRQASLQNVINTELARFNPSECILNELTYNNSEIVKFIARDKNTNIYCYPDWNKHAEDASNLIKSHFKITHLKSFDLDNNYHAQKASASLLGYLKHTQKDRIDHIHTIKNYSPEDYVILDRSIVSNLELFSTIRDSDQKGTLISVLDNTSTAMGGRMLREWLKKPLCKKEDIEERLNSVSELLKNRLLRNDLKNILKQISDIPRLVSRLSIGIGNAYDLVNLKESLKQVLEIKNILKNTKALSAQLGTKCLSTENIHELISLIDITINDNPPIDTKDGGLIKPGINKQLDELRSIVTGGKDWIGKMETKERKRTGINSLKIKFNKIFGFYIEISKANLQSVPENYFRKQTMINAERFITPELKVYEEKILTAQDTINKLEYEIFSETVSQVLSFTPTLHKISETIAIIDCLVNFANIAEKNNYVKPKIIKSGEIKIIDGRHPVVEKLCADPFVPNDILLNHDDHQLIIITGPNMAGKSVTMRQVAIITLMVHIGCFVPASDTEISLVDRIFVRSGASDFIASGLSTFMVEMVETAHILNHATKKSLIIMDEIGRGTSTYDGISIAWAVAEYIVKNIGAKTLFATHYHELQMLESEYPNFIKNYNVAVEQKQDGDPIFLHKLLPGGSSHSYAIAVARLAGVPKSVTNQAQNLLEKLEQKNSDSPVVETRHASSLPNDNILQEITNLNLDNLTPIEALNVLEKMKKRLNH